MKYAFSERLELGTEVFAHGREGLATPQTMASMLVDAGGCYHFPRRPGEQFLFAYGHSVSGQTENYAYAGLYWTWGKDKGGAGAPGGGEWLRPPTGVGGLR